MVVVIANDIPPAVRGRMKLWFIEPRANVFVSGIKDSVAEGVINYLLESCPARSGLLVLQRTNRVPYYRVWGAGDPKKTIANLDGWQLIFEKIEKENRHI